MATKSWWRRLLDRPWVQGNPLLHVAVMAGRQRAFDWLVRVGADPHVRDARGLSIVHTAALHPRLADAQPFLQRALDAGLPVDDRDADGYTALHFAVFHDRSDVVAWLLDHGASLRARTTVGTTALRHAIRWRRSNAARSLLEAGAYVDERDFDGETPLLEATVNPALAGLLLEFGADVAAINHHGDNLLHLAGSRCNPEMVRWALLKGVPSHGMNATGKTPLQTVQAQISALYGGFDGLLAAFAEPGEDEKSMTAGEAAGKWSLVLKLLGHQQFAHLAEG